VCDVSTYVLVLHTFVVLSGLVIDHTEILKEILHSNLLAPNCKLPLFTYY